MGFFHKKPRYKHGTKRKFADRDQYITTNGYARFMHSDKLVHVMLLRNMWLAGKCYQMRKFTIKTETNWIIG